MKTKTTLAIYDPLGNLLAEFHDQRFAVWTFSQYTALGEKAVLDAVKDGGGIETERGYKLVVID